MDASKACQDTDVPRKIFKENAGIFADFLHARFNEFVKTSEFPSVLKQANITPVYKKGERECKNNYRPVSILSNVSKIFERIMLRQYQIIWILFFPSINVDLGKDKAHNNDFCPCLKNGNVLWIMGRQLDYC